MRECFAAGTNQGVYQRRVNKRKAFVGLETLYSSWQAFRLKGVTLIVVQGVKKRPVFQ